jgi:hypothetical protein
MHNIVGDFAAQFYTLDRGIKFAIVRRTVFLTTSERYPWNFNEDWHEATLDVVRVGVGRFVRNTELDWYAHLPGNAAHRRQGGDLQRRSDH